MMHLSHAWEENHKIVDKVERLLQNDSVKLFFPHEGFSGEEKDGTTFSSTYYVRLENSIKYTVVVTIKGEDSEGNTVSKKDHQIISVYSQLGNPLRITVQKIQRS